MNTKTIAVSIAIALVAVFIAACDRPATQSPAERGAASAPATPPPPASATPSTPANTGTPSPAEKSEGANPQQQQVDPKQPEQRRDFQQK
jgi:hypothetical protein